MNATFRLAAHIRHNPAVPLRERPELMGDVDAELFARIDWINESIDGDKGSYFIAKGPRGVLWICDGRDCIAAVDPWRLRRFLYRGIARRREKLLASYLGNGRIPLPEGAQVINYGANIGEVAIAAEAKGCVVTAIEPDPNVIPALLLNSCGKRITVLPVAAWHTDGLLPIYVATEKADTSAINLSEEKIFALGRRLDTITEDLWIDKIHLIAGDAEGAEPEILAGASETLKRTRYVSLRIADERNGKSSRDMCVPILEDAGFEIISDDNETLIAGNLHV